MKIIIGLLLLFAATCQGLSQQSQPLRNYLRPDGTLNLPENFSGSLDANGFRMRTGRQGEPRFIPVTNNADSSWDDGFRYPGINGTVYACAFLGSDLYVSGSVSIAGGNFDEIAKWNGSEWSSIGQTNGTVNAMLANDTVLYIGGSFTVVNGDSAYRIAKWNGSTWSPLGGGMNNIVSALTMMGSDLYAGGSFTTAGGVSAFHVAKWNSTAWTALGGGTSGSVNSLVAMGTDLYAGGLFATAGGNGVNNIARWTGSVWAPLGAGTNGTVNALLVIGGELYAGGAFTMAGGVPRFYIAKWDGINWSAVGSMGQGIKAMTTIGTDIYAGGYAISGKSKVKKWDGISWSDCGSEMTGGDPFSGGVNAIASSGSDIFAGGDFILAGGIGAIGVARWNGSAWLPLHGEGEGMVGTVSALAVSGSSLYAGGTISSAGGVAVNSIARWNGVTWSPLGGGVKGAVRAIAIIGDDLYAGGIFDSAGGVGAKCIARWNGANWFSVGTGVATGGGLGPEVLALKAIGSDLYVGGYFTTAGGGAANNIAKWNGSTWSALGSGLNGTAQAFETIGSDLYVGGAFNNAGGGAASNIAKWNGASWSALGGGLSGFVNALAAIGTDLYCGGEWPASGSVASNIAKWNGSAWSAPSSGMDAAVLSLVASGNELYAGGGFSTAGGTQVNQIAKWNGTSWTALGSGMDGQGVNALLSNGPDLYAGGSFTKAGGKYSTHIARWKLAHPADWSWANDAGGTGNDVATGVVTDDSGNVYVTGYFDSSASFGGVSIQSYGSADIFLAKYDAHGNVVWAKGAGGLMYDSPVGISIDPSGNVYVAGTFQSTTMNFDTVSLNNAGGGNDIFIVKYDRSGNCLWARAAGGTSSDYAQSVCTDASGYAYMTGFFNSPTLQFGGTPALTLGGGTDLFIVKYSANGSAVWSRSAAGNGGEYGLKITSDSTGTTYCTGYFTGTSITFGSTPPLTQADGIEVFVVKCDSAGTPLWSRKSDGGSNAGTCIALDPWGNIFVGGAFSSTSTTFGTTTLSNTGADGTFDLFVAKYSPSGNILWARGAGGSSADLASALCTDREGNIYVGGSFTSNTFAAAGFSLRNAYASRKDLFVVKYDSAGVALWPEVVGESEDESATDITVDPAGNLYVAGYFFSGSVGFGTLTVTNQDNADAFIAKLGSHQIYPTVKKGFSLRSGWNLVSVPVIPDNDSVDVLFPARISNAFAYNTGGYAVSATMSNGQGYWLKFAGPAISSLAGFQVLSSTIMVKNGWNLVGSISEPAAASSITSTPPGLVTSSFFGYAGSYFNADTIYPGSGYWVKVTGDGELNISTSTASPSNRIKIIPTSETPPPPPDLQASEPGMPHRFELKQNYPNPFNPVTRILYEVGSRQMITLKVYDLLGREMATLVDEVQEPGFKSITWDAGRYSSGMYFYRLTAGSFMDIKKMIVLK